MNDYSSLGWMRKSTKDSEFVLISYQRQPKSFTQIYELILLYYARILLQTFFFPQQFSHQVESKW